MKREYLYQFIVRFFGQLGQLVSSIWGWLLLLLSQLVVIDGVMTGLIALGAVFVLDYATGLWAAWHERKDKERNHEAVSPYFLESGKFRKSLLKLTTYFLFVGMSWLMWFLFFDGKIHLPLSSKDVNIISVAFGICIAIECWSILENMKRAGFDLIGKIKTAFAGFWQTFNTIKGD